MTHALRDCKWQIITNSKFQITYSRIRILESEICSLEFQRQRGVATPGLSLVRFLTVESEFKRAI